MRPLPIVLVLLVVPVLAAPPASASSVPYSCPLTYVVYACAGEATGGSPACPMGVTKVDANVLGYGGWLIGSDSCTSRTVWLLASGGFVAVEVLWISTSSYDRLAPTLHYFVGATTLFWQSDGSGCTLEARTTSSVGNPVVPVGCALGPPPPSPDQPWGQVLP